MQELQEEAQEAALMSVQGARTRAHRASCTQVASAEPVTAAIMAVPQQGPFATVV